MKKITLLLIIALTYFSNADAMRLDFSVVNNTVFDHRISESSARGSTSKGLASKTTYNQSVTCNDRYHNFGVWHECGPCTYTAIMLSIRYKKSDNAIKIVIAKDGKHKAILKTLGASKNPAIKLTLAKQFNNDWLMEHVFPDLSGSVLEISGINEGIARIADPFNIS